MFNYTRFLKQSVAFSTFYLIIIFLINCFADPYGLRRYGGRVNNAHLVKAITVNRIKPSTVLMGSSGVARGLNPDNPILAKHGKVYNYSILGASIYELKRYFQHVAHNGHLNAAILSLDFYAFNGLREVRPGFSESRLGTNIMLPQDFFSLYLSLDSLKLNANPNLRGVYFSKNGTYNHEINAQKRSEIFAIELQEDFSPEEQMYASYQPSSETVGYFERIVDLAKDEEIDLTVFIPPLHVTLFYAAMLSEYWPTYQQWMRDIVAVQPVWDFSGCNSVTTEPISPHMKNFEDPSHYTFKTGDHILARILGNTSQEIPADFGVLVTSKNVDKHLEQVKSQCELWKKQNPEIVQWLKKFHLNGELTTQLGRLTKAREPKDRKIWDFSYNIRQTK